MRQFLVAAAAIAALAVPHASGQTGCSSAMVTSMLSGTVRDVTQALVPGATVVLDGRQKVVSRSNGSFQFACVTDGKHRLRASAKGFAPLEEAVTAPHASDLNLVLKLEDVETQVEVDAEDGPAKNASSSGPTQTIAGDRLQSLADDPDDLKRELQQLAAVGGGSPTSTTISVDGFQGASAIPPKSSIAYIEVNPDQFSAQYREPPFDGARVEIYTKPGQKTYHGAVFATNGSPWENARDPFSVSSEAIGKQRYGFELEGPIRKQGSDFALTLEHRSIDNFAVVDAITLDASGNEAATTQSVGAPQRLWLAAGSEEYVRRKLQRKCQSPAECRRGR
jgi:hypothetical protein